MKRAIIFLVLIVVMLMSACMQEAEIPAGKNEKPKEIQLRELEGRYELTDDRTYGAWTFTVAATQLEAEVVLNPEMTLEINATGYLLRPNRFKQEQYFCLLPEELEETGIKAGKIKTGYEASAATSRDGEELTFYSFYIIKEPGENGTTLYEVLYEDYMEMKAAKHPFLYDDAGKLLRPEYMKTTEGYVYTKQTFYDARQLANPHTTSGAFAYLKTLADHDAYLIDLNPNIVTIVNNEPVVEEPDTRERVRDLGTMGTIADNAYNITDISEESKLFLQVNHNNIDQEKYGAYDVFAIYINGITECELTEGTTQGIYELDIPYATTSSIDLIKNARFEGGSSSPFAGGNGTEGEPYQVSSWEQLDSVRDYLQAFFILTTDLSSSDADYAAYAGPAANDNNGWMPIGKAGDNYYSQDYEANAFAGQFDGDHHKISDLYIEKAAGAAYGEEDNLGLFGFVRNATITNCHVEDIYIKGSNYLGGISGDHKGGIIDHCTMNGTIACDSNTGGIAGVVDLVRIENCTSTAYIEGDLHMGGMLGLARDSTVVDCSNEGTVTWSGVNGVVGGLIGTIRGTTVTNCHSSVNILGSVRLQAGGFAGTVDYSSSVEECYSAGSVAGNNDAGGFVGQNEGTIMNCYSIGDVTGDQSEDEKYVGGFVGQNRAIIENCYSTGNASGKDKVGGFVGGNIVYYAKKGEISNCYSTGAVQATNNNGGGFAGQVDTLATVTNCYWDTDTSGLSVSAGPGTIGKTSVDMKKETTFENWDFTNNWMIEENNSYPYLRNNIQEPKPGF